MSLASNRNARNRRLTVETLESRLTPAYPTYTPLTGAANPLAGVSAGLFTKPALGDLDGDGDLDLVSGNSAQDLRFYKNTGTATAPNYVEQTGAANPFGNAHFDNHQAPALGDVDGDGDLDLLVGLGGTAGTVVYMKNTGTATAPTFVAQSGSADPFAGVTLRFSTQPSFGDVDGDGDLDLLVGSSFAPLAYFENTGTRTAPVYTQQAGSSNPFEGISTGQGPIAALGDVDGDGDLDLAVGNIGGVPKYFENTGTATAPNYVEQAGVANPFGGIDVGLRAFTALGDIDGDGDLDLVLGAGSSSLRTYRNDSAPPAVGYSLQTGVGSPFDGLNPGSLSDPAAGDLDGDGDLDLLAANNSGELRYYENTGTATAPAYVLESVNPFSYVAPGRDTSPALGDLDGDGDLDLFVGDRDGYVHYFENTGTATSPTFVRQFVAPDYPLDVADAGANSRPALGDVDGDGDLDLAVGQKDGTVVYYRNTGTRTAPSLVRQTGPANPFESVNVVAWNSPTLGDVDGDGDLDLVVSNLDGQTTYYPNSGTATSPVYGTSSAAVTFDFFGPAQSPDFADVDGDGDGDVIVGQSNGTLAYYRQNRAPVVGNALPDQTFSGQGAKSCTVPADAFRDLDRDALTYGATLAGGAALPGWLGFDAATRTFTGNPTTADTTPLQVRVTATDPNGASVFDDFQLTLANVSDAPTVGSDQGAVSVDEGSQVANTGTFDDHDGRATVTLTASLGTVTQDDAAGTWAWSYTPPSNIPSPGTVTITATDQGDLFATTTFTLSVARFPTVSVTVAGGVYNGRTFGVTSASATGLGGVTLASVSPDSNAGALSFRYFQGATQLPGVPKDVGSYTAVAVFTSNVAGYLDATSAPAPFSITPATLTVIADADPNTEVQDAFFKAAGSADPALTYRATGFQLGDTATAVLSGALARDPGEALGAYAVRQGSLVANGNYTISFAEGVLNVRGLGGSIVSTRIDDGNAQRSMVRSLSVTFSDTIAAADLPAVLAQLQLTRIRDSLAIGLTATLDGTGKTLTLKFTGTGILGGSLADGRYALSYAGTAVASLHRLFGDIDGNAEVNAADQAEFNKAMNTRRGITASYSAYLDYTQDGLVINSDQTEFGKRKGKRLDAGGNLVSL